MNAYNMKHFAQHVSDGDYEDLALWQANVGRSLSLGDFAMVNAARTELPDAVVVDDEFYLEMVRILMAAQSEVLPLAESEEDLLFCCSGPDDEVALVWSKIEDA
jgi:hypothetical protein